MLKSLFKEKNTSFQLLMFTGISMMCFGIFSFLSILMVRIFWQIDLTQHPDMLYALEQPGMLSAFKFMQSFQSIGLFIFPCLLFGLLVSDNSMQWLGFQGNKRLALNLLLGLLIMVLAQPFINWMADFNSRLPLSDAMVEAEERAAEITKVFLKMNHWEDVLINLLIIGILPGLGEELFFRGTLQKLFIKASRNVHVGIWVSAASFSIMHFQFMGFIPRMMMGVALGYMKEWSGTLWVPVLAHMANNSLAVLVNYAVQQKQLEETVENVGSRPEDIITVLVSVFVVLMLMQRMHAQQEKIKTVNSSGDELN
jgi:uncharacterized protein